MIISDIHQVTDLRVLAALGKLTGARLWAVSGGSAAIQTTEPPFLLSDLKTPYVFPTAAQSLELISTGAGAANDNAAGTGARLILVELLDADYNEVSLFVVPTAGVAVPLPGSYIAVNALTVLSTGSTASNAGLILVRVAGGGATLGSIPATKSISHAFRFTVAAGKALHVDNLYFNPGNSGGSNLIVTINFKIRLENGTVIAPPSNLYSGAIGPLSITLPSGFVIPEKASFFYTVDDVSANGANMTINASGTLYTLSRL